jgi:hypothetical protein
MLRITRLSALLIAVYATGQTTTSPARSDPLAINLAQQAMFALTGGSPVSDITFHANIVSIVGSDYRTGSGTFRAKGINESRIDLDLRGKTRSDVRSSSSGIPTGSWEVNGRPPKAYPQHNCWIEAVWFYPALSSLSQTADSKFVFQYIGKEQHASTVSEHITVFQKFPFDPSSTLSPLTRVDFYLDPISKLPLAAVSNLHPDNDMSRNVRSEVRFANYRTVKGLAIPMHIQSLLSGTLILDITVADVALDSGVSDTVFSLP